MSCTRAPLECLICGNKHLIKDVEEHVHEHLKYFPYKCNDCDFARIRKSELKQHTYDSDHTGTTIVDPYQQWLVDTITEDIEFAEKFGKEALWKKKNIPFNPSTPTQSSTTRSPPLRKQLPTPAPPASPPPPVPVLESSSDEDDAPPPKAAKKSLPVVTKRKSDNKPAPQRRQREDEGESEDEDYEIRYLRKENQKYAMCMLCRQKILFGLDKRQAHIRDEHMDDVPEGKRFQPILEETTKAAFPGLVWNCKQCSRCNTQKEIQTIQGRITHVVTHHYHTPLNCPKKGCPHKSVNPDFKKHFIEAHATPTWRKLLPETEFHTALANHKSKLETVSKLIFTVDFPEGSNSAKQKRKTSDRDDDDEAVDFSELYAAAPIRPAARPTPKRRRSKSPSSDEEDSDDDKPTNSKKEKEKIVRRDKNGAMRLVEASDEEEEEGSGTERESKEDSGEEQRDVEDKEDERTRGSSVSSTAATTNGNSRRDDCKREPSPEMKDEEEIKVEPMTPVVRPRTTLLETPIAFSRSLMDRETAGWSGRQYSEQSYGHPTRRGRGNGRDLAIRTEERGEEAMSRQQRRERGQSSGRGRGRGGFDREGRGGRGGRGGGGGGFDRGVGGGFERRGFNSGEGNERQGGYHKRQW